MKRCPTCSRTFTDPNLSFCIEDGTPLVSTDEPNDPEATIVSPSPVPEGGGSRATASEGQTSAPTDWKGPAYQPPGQFSQAPGVPKRKAWPWVVGVLAILMLALIGVGIAAAILIPDLMRASRNKNQNSAAVPVNTRANQNDNQNSNLNDNSNSTVPNDNANVNSNTETEVDTPPPTNEELVLSELKNIEDEWTVANLNADKKKLAQILADDYVGTTADGAIQGKADYLRDIKPDTAVKHWEFQDLKLVLKGDRATLTGTVKLENEAQDELVLRFIDKFVWRGGRWQ